MEKGLGELGFWLAVGMVIAAMIVAGAIKERDRERDRQAMLRADLERKQAARQALLENAGGNITEVLAYLRERDAAAAAHMARAKAEMNSQKKITDRRTLGFAGAFVVGAFSFVGGVIVSGTLSPPRVAFPRFAYSPEAGRMILQPPPPPPTGWAHFLPAGVVLAIWAAGLIVAALMVLWGFGRQKHDARPDA